jgi:2-iminobutanoate/2-iminopropanoate deaminase
MKNISILSLVFLLFLASCTMSPEKQVIRSENAPTAIGPYSQAIMVGNTLYVSGNIAIDPKTSTMDTLTIEAEIRRVMSNLGAVLEEAGMSYANIVKATIFTTDLGHYQLINSIYGEYFEEAPPARETVQVAALPAGAHVEISCIAVK